METDGNLDEFNKLAGRTETKRPVDKPEKAKDDKWLNIENDDLFTECGQIYL